MWPPPLASGTFPNAGPGDRVTGVVYVIKSGPTKPGTRSHRCLPAPTRTEGRSDQRLSAPFLAQSGSGVRPRRLLKNGENSRSPDQHCVDHNPLPANQRTISARIPAPMAASRGLRCALKPDPPATKIAAVNISAHHAVAQCPGASRVPSDSTGAFGSQGARATTMKRPVAQATAAEYIVAMTAVRRVMGPQGTPTRGGRLHAGVAGASDPASRLVGVAFLVAAVEKGPTRRPSGRFVVQERFCRSLRLTASVAALVTWLAASRISFGMTGAVFAVNAISFRVGLRVAPRSGSRPNSGLGSTTHLWPSLSSTICRPIASASRPEPDRGSESFP